MSGNLLSKSFSDYLFVESNSVNYPCKEKDSKLSMKFTIHTNDTISFLKNKYPNNYKTQKNVIKNMVNDDFKNVNLPVLLEFYRMEGDLIELTNMIEILQASKDSTEQTWAKLYKLMIQFYSHQISPQDLINAVMEIPTSSGEMKIFSLIVHLFGVSRLYMLDSLNKISTYVLPLVDDVENDYLRNSYRFQLLQFHASSNLLINNLARSRELCQEAEDLNLYELYPFSYSNFYHVMAQSYIFTDFDKTVFWLNKASTCLLSLTTNWVQPRIRNLQNTLYFVENYWRKNVNCLPPDPSEAAHRYIIKKEYQEATMILDQLYKQNGCFTPFQEYYYAIATKDPKRLQFSKEKFAWKSNYYYFQLFNKNVLKRYDFF